MITLNEKPVKTDMFPDNTSQVWKVENLPPKGLAAKVVWTYSHEGEFMQLAQLRALLHKNENPAYLTICYLPYGRQDKEISNEATFALQPFAALLNFLDFRHVTIVDPHSTIATDLIYNSDAYYPITTILNLISKTSTDLLCYPDKGALGKYASMFEMDHVYGEKVRDQSSGWITDYALIGDVKDKTVLIVDDICDGGMTFKLLANALMENGAKEVNLYVSHGLFSKGLKTLKENKINRIFTKEGECSEVQGNITYRRL